MASYSFGKSRIDAPQNIIDDRSPDLAGMSLKLLPELVIIQQSFELELNLVVPMFKRNNPVSASHEYENRERKGRDFMRGTKGLDYKGQILRRNLEQLK